MERRSIIHISKYYIPYPGGTEDVAESIVMCSAEVREQVVICFSDGRIREEEEKYDADVCKSGDGVCGLRIRRFAEFVKVSSQSFSFDYFKAIGVEMDKDPNAIIHIHLPNPFAVCALLGHLKPTHKLVSHWHTDIVKKPFYFLVKGFERRLLEKSDVILCTSPIYSKCSQPLEDFQDKIEILPNFINKNKDGRPSTVDGIKAKLKEKYGDKKIVFSFGRHVKYKGLCHLIEAAKTIGEKAQIVIAGSGPLTADLKEQAKGMNNVEFIGRIPDDEVIAYLEFCTVFAFPSITKNEAFGLALLEAMNRGAVPVTMTIEGSGVNWVCPKDQCGLEVENSNSKAFAEAVMRLLEDEDLRRRLSEGAKKYVAENFVREKIFSKMLQIYETLDKG